MRADPGSYEQQIIPQSRPLGEEPDIWVSTYGVFRSHGGFSHELLGTTPNLHLIRSGSGSCRIDDLELQLGPGDCVVFHPGCRVRYHDQPGRPWRYDWFMLEGRRCQELLRTAGLPPERPCRPASDLLPLLDRLRPLLQAGDPFASMRAAWLLCEGLIAGAHYLHEVPTVDDALARSARLLIDSRYMNPLSIVGLAADLGVSRASLFRHFRERYGIAPQAYLQQKRLERACQLLLDSALGVTAIAHACGFTDPDAFSRSFKRHLGHSPSAWRKSGKS